MTDLWNFWDLKPPPVCTVKTELHFKGISDLNEVTFNAFKTLRDIDYLDREAAILSRFLYKYRRIFRHDKGLQNLVKMNQCLKKYLKLDLSGLLFTFKQVLPHNLKPTATIAYLPTKQMLKWVLLRLQTFAQLFVRVTELAKETGVWVYKKLCLGWALNLSLLVFSITARILTTSKFLVAKSIEWYAAFYNCLPHLRETADFLPNYEFPVDLKLWLGKVDLLPLKKKSFADEIFELIDLVNDDEEKEDGEEDSDSEVKIVKEKFIKSLFSVTDMDMDIEEITVEETKEERKGTKRPLNTLPLSEDFGVPVDEDDCTNEKKEDANRGWKKFKKKKERKRVKWLKKVKKTLNSYEKHGMSESSLSMSRSSKDYKTYLTID